MHPRRYEEISLPSRPSPTPSPGSDHLDTAVEVFRMLADATRVHLLWHLLDGERSVNELAEAVGRPAASVSQHLAKLRLARMVVTRRQGTQIFYAIGDDHVQQLVRDAVHHAEHAVTDVPAHHQQGAEPGRDARNRS